MSAKSSRKSKKKEAPEEQNQLDITERRQFEEALKESHRKYQALFNNKTVGLSYCQTLFDEHNQPVDYIVLGVNATVGRLPRPSPAFLGT